jgi:hypothetical protein
VRANGDLLRLSGVYTGEARWPLAHSSKTRPPLPLPPPLRTGDLLGTSSSTATCRGGDPAGGGPHLHGGVQIEVGRNERTCAVAEAQHVEYKEK